MNKKILIVEDDRLTLYLLKRRLEKKGYEILTARDEKEFWKHAFDQGLHLILLDICLKNRLGTNVYKTLLEFGMNRQLPVIFTTGLTDDMNDMDSGGKDILDKRHVFLPKPINFENLNQEIERLTCKPLSNKVA